MVADKYPSDVEDYRDIRQMGERLAGGNVAIARIVNTLSTVDGLYPSPRCSDRLAVLNPAESAVMASRGS